MPESWESSEPSGGHPSGFHPSGKPPSAPNPNRGMVSERAAELWRMLGPSDGPTDDPPGPSTSVAGPAERPQPGLVDDELGELLARAWYDTDRPAETPGEPAETPVEPAEAKGETAGWDSGAWEVERLPTAAEGGVAALFKQNPGGSTGRPSPPPPPPPPPRDDGPTLDSFVSPLDATSPAAPPLNPPPLGSQPPAWGANPGVAPPISGRARLTEMLGDLPQDATPRVRAEDVQVQVPTMAPAAIWFWGDDDIYPGGVAGTGPESAAARQNSGRSKRAARSKARAAPKV